MRLLSSFALVLVSLATQALAADAGNKVGLYSGPLPTEALTIEQVKKCKEHGIGMLLPSVSCGGGVLWKTDKADYCNELKPQFDAGYDGLAVLIRHARAAGIKVYPSVAICPGGRLIQEHPEWETRDRHGRPSSATTTGSIALSYREVRAARIALVMDLVRNYDIDGVLLDYCRYPENTRAAEQKYGFYGYDAPLINACRELYGFDPTKEPIDSPNWTLFNTMRRETVTAFVREFREAVAASGKAIRIGGFGDTDPVNEARACARDYAAWARRGYIDDMFLATYTEPIDQMKATVRTVRKAVGPKVVLHSALTPFNNFLKTNDEMQRAAAEQFAGGADAVWIYREDFLSKLDLWEGAKLANQIASRR